MPDYHPEKAIESFVAYKRLSYSAPDFSEERACVEAGVKPHNTPHTPLIDMGDVIERASFAITFFDTLDKRVLTPSVPLASMLKPVWQGSATILMLTYTWFMRPLQVASESKILVKQIRPALCAHRCLPTEVAFKLVEYRANLEVELFRYSKHFSRDPALAAIARKAFLVTAAMGMDMDTEGTVEQCISLFQSFLQTLSLPLRSVSLLLPGHILTVQDVAFDMLWDEQLETFDDNMQLTPASAKYKDEARQIINNNKLVKFLRLFMESPGANRLLHILDPASFLAPIWMKLDKTMEQSMAAEIRAQVEQQTTARRAAWQAKLAEDARKVREAGMQMVLYRPIVFRRPGKRSAECAPAEPERAPKRQALGELRVNTLGQGK